MFLSWWLTDVNFGVSSEPEPKTLIMLVTPPGTDCQCPSASELALRPSASAMGRWCVCLQTRLQ